MAEKRMFTKTIVDSDVFLDMPQSTQNLYFHLNMRADDEGFINAPKKIMRMIGANQNDLDVLLSKRYLLGFDSGVVVVKHWKLHNAIRKDRLKETVYTDEKMQITEKANGVYTDNLKTLQPIDNQLTTNCQHRLDKIRLEENRLDKYSLEEIETVSKKPTKNKYGEYKNVLLTKDQYSKLIKNWGEDKTLMMISKLDEGIQLKGYKYKDHNLALRKWESKEPQKTEIKDIDYTNLQGVY